MLHGKMLFLKPSESGLKGSLRVPGDKSISHRSLMLGSVAVGVTEITGLLESGDVLSTMGALKEAGADISRLGANHYQVVGKGFNGLKTPPKPLELGNSGTSARLLAGLFAHLAGPVVFKGDASLSKRPMKRITEPLSQMGVTIAGVGESNHFPLTLQNEQQVLRPLTYDLPVASAQVKSALILAAIQAEGLSSIKEPSPSRNHTEVMLENFGGEISQNQDGRILVTGSQKLIGTNIAVPGDFSSAAFWLVAALLVPKSHISVEDVGLNETRTGLLEVFEQMKLKVEVATVDGRLGEKVGVVSASYQQGAGTVVGGDLIPKLIDELPLVALLATQMQGTTVIKDAAELRVKETDRIAAIVANLSKMGASIEATADGMVIKGPTPLKGAVLESYGDHRIAMMAVIASLIAEGETRLLDAFVFKISYPTFLADLQLLLGK